MRLAAIAALSLSFAACRCAPPESPPRPGELGIVVDGVVGPDGTYDFGQVAMGLKKTVQVELTNRGLGVLDIERVERISGDAVKIGVQAEPVPVFVFGDAVGSLGPGETVKIDATFLAPVSSAMQTEHETVLRITLGNATAGGGTLTLRGTAVQGQCMFPGAVDFGAVMLNDTAKQTRAIVNDSPLTATATVGAITSPSGDHLAFGLAPESARGDFDVASGASRDVVFTFKPTEARVWSATVTVRAAAECPLVTTTLTGRGVDELLVCDPSPLDLGYLTPGLSRTGELKIQNLGLAPVALTGVAARVGSAPSTELVYSGPADVTVPGGGSATLPVTFRPQLLGLRQAALVASTPLARQPMLSCALRGTGGGPDIDVAPATLNVGRVPVFSGSGVTRKVTIRNLGTLPNPPDANGNLKLGAIDVVPKNAQTTAAQLCVGEYDPMAATPCPGRLPAVYNPAVGLRAAAGELLDVPIRVMPSAVGLSLEWDVVFHSNDPDEEAVTVNVRAESVALPPCNYSVYPATLSFGLLTAPSNREHAITVTNLGTNPNEICLISSFDLASGTDPVFTLPGGPLLDAELQPGQAATLRVRATATTSGTMVQNVAGTATLQISSPATPRRDVALTASLGPSCLVVSPSSIDFGTVKKDCASGRRTVTAYNACSTTVTVQSYTMLAVAGQPAGGPNCPGTSACPEFILDGSSTATSIPPGGTMPLSYTFVYRPIDYGSDSGAFRLQVVQNGVNVDYVVPLRGTGDALGLQTDSWRQEATPKSDVLLVIDNSCSMADDQMALAANLATFIAGASFSNVAVDFHIGVTITELTDPMHGVLIGDATNPKVLTRTTPMLQQLFAQKVIVGTNGGSEAIAAPALRAVTPPFVNNENAGFLRQDATLAVIGITDEPDQSPMPDAFYAAQLLAVKNGQSHLITWNIIGPNQTTCAFDENPSTHDFLTTFFHGVRGTICMADWAALLADIAKPAFGYRNVFYLSAEADLMASPVVVKLDGVTLAETTATGAQVWRYDAVANAVTFEPNYVPEPGTLLTVTYAPVCH